MFGQNPVAPRRDTLKSFLVKSIFDTIQGEGPYSGHRATFIRFGGCNLKCNFCDTDFTSDLDEMTGGEICNYLLHETVQNELIVLTGGEPMLQNLPLLIDTIQQRLPFVKTIQIETAGTVWPDGFEMVLGSAWLHVEIVVSPKTPKINEKVRTYGHYWKYIISASEGVCDLDGLPKKTAWPGRGKPVYIQPMDEQDVAKNTANMHLARQVVLKHGYRLSLQVHKLIGVE